MKRPEMNVEETGPDKRENYVYLLESVPHASRIAPAQAILFGVLTLFLTIACFAWWTDPPQGRQVPPAVLLALWFVGLLIVGFLCFRMRVTPAPRDVWIGRDFIAGPTPGQERGTGRCHVLFSTKATRRFSPRLAITSVQPLPAYATVLTWGYFCILLSEVTRGQPYSRAVATMI